MNWQRANTFIRWFRQELINSRSQPPPASKNSINKQLNLHQDLRLFQIAFLGRGFHPPPISGEGPVLFGQTRYAKPRIKRLKPLNSFSAFSAGSTASCKPSQAKELTGLTVLLSQFYTNSDKSVKGKIVIGRIFFEIFLTTSPILPTLYYFQY